MSAAHPPTTTPLVKQEEQITGEELVPKPESNVSDADAHLLLAFHMHDNIRARASTPPVSASRVSIQALLNAVDDEMTSSRVAIPIAPLSAPPRITSFAQSAFPPSSTSSPTRPPPPPISQQTKSKSKSKSGPSRPALEPPSPLAASGQELVIDPGRATKSMSISVEPEAVPKSKPASKAKPPKLGKGRGRVSKGPKKRQGKGWIIESCTTSGAPSDAEPELDPATDPATEHASQPSSPVQEVESRSKPVIIKDLFDGDSDLTDLEDSESGSSSSEVEVEVEEYDPGLAGLPPVPMSSGSEYEPVDGLNPNANPETRSRRRMKKVDYGVFQASARPSVRLATRTPVTSPSPKAVRTSRSHPQGKSKEREGAKSKEPDDEESDEEVEEPKSKRGRKRAGSGGTAESQPTKSTSRSTKSTLDSQPTKSNKDSRPTKPTLGFRLIKNAASSSRTKSSTSDSRPTKALPRRKAKPPSTSASSVSLGEWQDDPSSSPGKNKRVAMAKDVVDASSPGRFGSGMSSLTELTESSPSLGGGRLLDSPMMGEKELGAANISGRSDAGATHVSESVESRGETDGEGERARRWDMVRDEDMPYEEPPENEFVGRDGVGGPNLGHDGQKRRMSDTTRFEWRLREAGGPLRSFSSPLKTPGPFGSPMSSGRKAMEVVLPTPPPQKSSSGGSKRRSTRSNSSGRKPMMRAVLGRISTSRGSSPVEVYVLVPRFESELSEVSSTGPGSSKVSEKTSGESMSISDVSEEPPTKRARQSVSSSAKGKDKGKGKAVDRSDALYEPGHLSRKQSRRVSKPTARLVESRRQDVWGELDEDGHILPRIDEDMQLDAEGIDHADHTSVSGRRNRRSAKPTMRAIESALQEQDWSDGEPSPLLVTLKEQLEHSSKLGKGEAGLYAAQPSEITESSIGHSLQGGSKRPSTVATESSRPSKKSRIVKSESAAGGSMVELHEGDFILRPQSKRCFHYDYDQTIVPRCLACRKKKFGDTCRFIHVRWLQLNHKTFDPVGVKFDSLMMKHHPTNEYHLPMIWNITPDIHQVERMRLAIARSLHKVLHEELAHAQKPGIIRRAVEIEVRATCDVCATSMFSSCHMCTRCGRELCGICFERVEEMCPPGTPLEYDSADRKDPQLHKYRACAGGRVFHIPADFRPITRFTRDELDQTVQEMEDIIHEHQEANDQAQIANWASSVVPEWTPASPHTSTEPPALSSAGSSHDVSSPRGTPDPQLPSMPVIASPTMSPTHEEGFTPEVAVEPGKRPVVSQQGRSDPAAVPSHSVHSFSKHLSEEEFKPLWARGEAIVVHDLLDRFKIQWTPDYFIEEHGEQECLVVNCDDNKVNKTTVALFFEQFGKTDRPPGVLKLKDWPAQADFKDDFPALFDDFMGALPVPNYTRRDGILNLASHFATNAIAPDLGPKMYNAFTSSEGPGGQGSTRLHMDMADAVNIMMYASDCPDGSPGVAAWDIFRACDSEKIRSYLRRHFQDKASEYRDPIHSQLFYLDSDHRKRLYEEEKVHSWRIYQRPGDAVFIPAGCAHQVCNLADCIKVAVDFVSLENIDRCEKLTAEFRNENDTFTWKEDVLQLRTMMMYAWRSTCQLRAAWDEACEAGDQEPSEEQSLV